MTTESEDVGPTVTVVAETLCRMLNEHFFDCDHDYGECPRDELLRALERQTPGIVNCDGRVHTDGSLRLIGPCDHPTSA